MRVEVDNNYGADRDGNRGIIATNYELEESDREEIISQIGEFMMYNSYIPETISVHMVCPITENDVEICTHTKEWLDG